MLLAAAMEVAAPGDEGRPDREHAAERAKEEPCGDGAKYAETDCECSIGGHLNPLFGWESGWGLPVTSQAVHRLYGTKPAIISTRLRAELSPVLSHFEHGIAIMPKNWAGNRSYANSPA